jgi:hypothetical protein
MSVEIVLGAMAVVGLSGLLFGLIGPRRNKYPEEPHPHGDARYATPEETAEAMKGAGGRVLDLDDRMF